MFKALATAAALSVTATSVFAMGKSENDIPELMGMLQTASYECELMAPLKNLRTIAQKIGYDYSLGDDEWAAYKTGVAAAERGLKHGVIGYEQLNAELLVQLLPVLEAGLE